MSNNDNTVNIKSRGARYHHGDLRAALIEEGLEQLSQRPADEVSLREIARNVGVSATAVYRHFPDKAALLAALCIIGDEKLSAAFRTAMEKAADARSAFDAMGRAYVHFALQNPSLFRLMMANSGPEKTMAPEPDGSGDAFSMLLETLRNLLPADAPPELLLARRLQAWSMVHGLAMLMLDGQVPADEALIAPVISSSFL